MTQNIFVDGILKDRVAFVTGGGTGITGGVARALAEAGANVALASRSMDHLEAATKIINEAQAQDANVGEAFAVSADVRNPEEVEKAIGRMAGDAVVERVVVAGQERRGVGAVEGYLHSDGLVAIVQQIDAGGAVE